MQDLAQARHKYVVSLRPRRGRVDPRSLEEASSSQGAGGSTQASGGHDGGPSSAAGSTPGVRMLVGVSLMHLHEREGESFLTCRGVVWGAGSRTRK